MECHPSFHIGMFCLYYVQDNSVVALDKGVITLCQQGLQLAGNSWQLHKQQSTSGNIFMLGLRGK